jgi:hypothetical protein
MGCHQCLRFALVKYPSNVHHTRQMCIMYTLGVAIYGHLWFETSANLNSSCHHLNHRSPSPPMVKIQQYIEMFGDMQKKFNLHAIGA